jgi:hypothetical protein
MQLHQKRVIDEKDQLDIKAGLLSNFIGNSPIFSTLSNAEQELLKEQCEIMWQYSEILGDRISLFSAQENK